MRIALLSGTLLAAAMLTAGLIVGPAEAAPYQGRWCAQMPISDDTVSERCDLDTIEACRREIVGVNGRCSLNPYYPGWDWGHRTRLREPQSRRR